ncbi:MAG: hypothetical protein HZB14_07345, partial [Actinobacteria bacterium]|nr:hypothetical protein [Actinomycetota bacterium]
MSVSGTCLRVNRAAFLAFAIAFCSALVLLATTANRADASFAITDFTLTPSTTQAGGHPNTHYHVDPDAPLADRTDGDDLKKVTIDFPAGLLANPEAANPKCTTSQFSSDKCPSTSYIGSMSVKWRERSWLWSTTASAAGSVYILTPATAGSAVTVGFILRPSGYRKIYLKTEVTGVVTVRSGTDADYGLTLVVDNIPRTMVTTGGSTKNITINDITVDINARANTSKTGPYFAFNPTRCTAANTRATITSYKNVVVTRNSSFTPSGCENVPFSATANVVPANPAPGASTAVSATFTTPTADAPIQNSHVAAIQVDLPEGTNLDFPAIAAIPATCTEAQVNADSCPAGSKIGTVSAAVPFLPPTMTGDVYLINRNNGILFGYVLRGSNGVKAALKGQAFTPDIDGDGSADLVRTIASNMPQAPWSSATINFSAALVKNPTACGMHTVSSTIHGWSGASVSQTNQWSDNGACDVTPPVVNITSPADGSSTTASSITLHFTATDDSGTTPSCDTTSGSSVALALGANTIAVTCTDSMGNSGSDSVTVNRKTFSPTYNQTVSNPVAGENTGLTIEFSSTGANASAISRAQAKTGAALPLDTAAIGDAAVDMCPTESLSGTGASATFDATACPPQALVGTASFTSSQLGAPMLGEIYLIEKSAIPHFGIKPVGSNGLSLVVFGDVTQFDPGCDPNAAPCDYTVQMTTSQLPNFGDSTLSLTFDAPDRVSDNGYPLNGKIFKIASAADNVCDGSLDSVGTMIPSATGSAVTDSDSDAIDCAGSDTTPPVVNITSPADGSSTAASSVTLTYTATDDSGGTPTCSPANNASVALNIGSNTIAVSCADSAGNTGSDSVTVIRIDNIAPTIGGLNCTLVGSYSCLLTYTASDNSGSVTCTPPSGTVIALTPGANTITVNCSDPSGNVSTASLTITISAPALTVAITDGPPNGGVTNDSTPTFTYQSNQQVWQQPYCPPGQVCVQVIQQVIGFRCTIDGGAPVECPANLTYGGQYTTPPLSDAPHTFCVTAYYTNGSGQSAPDCRTFEVHSGPPVFAITSPVNNSQTLAASTTVNYSQPSGATCTPANGSSVPLTVGANTITVSCTDAVGNVGTASVTVYRKTFAPTYNQTVSNPVAGQNTGLTIEFSSTGANAAAIRIAQATTGAALAPDTSAFGDYYYDQCPTSSIVGSGNTA